jgi:uncharacterized repeat protein (TIGR01451 family)
MRGLMRRAAVMAAAAGASVLAAGMVTVATATTAGAAATVAGVEAPLPANAASNPGVSLNSVSCASAANCTAAGNYIDSSGNLQGLLLTQTAGTWATGAEAPLPANAASNPFVLLNSVSCASAGNCTAVGSYRDSSFNDQGLLLTQTAGSWAAAEAVLPANAASAQGVFLNSVSCASPGNCTAAGHYLDSSGRQGLLLTQAAGSWAAGAEAPLPANAASNPFVFLASVSCASAGNCTAAGGYADSSFNGQGLLLTHTAGSWAAAEAVLPANAASAPGVGLASVSCASPGNCTAAGSYFDSSFNGQGLLLTQTAGTWATGAEAPLPANAASNPFVFLASVSCASAGNCTAVGGYLDSSGRQGLLLTQTAGSWAAAEAPLPANAASAQDVFLTSVSCASAGNCTAVDSYLDSSGNTQGLLLTQTQTSAADLSLSDTAPATAVSGQPYRYTLVATNTGGAAATGTVVTDTLPSSVHFDAASATLGSCTRTSGGSPETKGGTVTCKVGSLPTGARVTVTVKVTPTKPGTVSDAATVTASNVTADNDDTASAPVTVRGT